MRCDDAEQGSPLGVRLANQLDVAEPEIAQAAVDQLRRRARGGTAEVAAIDKSDAEPHAGRLTRDAGADDARPDDEQVERSPCQLGTCGFPPGA